MITLTCRNLKLFFRDKASVFFSLLSVFIVIALYVLFLGDNMIKDTGNVPDAKLLIVSWLMAGMLGVASITTTMGSFGIMVQDRDRKILKDFSVSPIKRYNLVGGYVLSSIIVGILISFVVLIISQMYILYIGGNLFSIVSFLKIVALIITTVTASSSMVFFIISFIKSQSAFSTASAVIGTLVGFLTGTYIPIGVLPESVGLFIKLFPPSHGIMMLRQLFTEEAIKVSFKNAPIEVIESFNYNMGIDFKFGDLKVTALMSLVFLFVTSIIFFSMAVMNLSRKNS